MQSEFGKIPDDVFEFCVFTFLSTPDLLGIERTCKKIQNWVKSNLKEVSLCDIMPKKKKKEKGEPEEEDMKPEEIENILKKYSKVTKLDLRALGYTKFEARSIENFKIVFETLTHVTKLHLKRFSVTNEILDYLSLNVAEKLRSVHFGGLNIGKGYRGRPRKNVLDESKLEEFLEKANQLESITLGDFLGRRCCVLEFPVMKIQYKTLQPLTKNTNFKRITFHDFRVIPSSREDEEVMKIENRSNLISTIMKNCKLEKIYLSSLKRVSSVGGWRFQSQKEGGGGMVTCMHHLKSLRYSLNIEQKKYLFPILQNQLCVYEGTIPNDDIAELFTSSFKHSMKRMFIYELSSRDLTSEGIKNFKNLKRIEEIEIVLNHSCTHETSRFTVDDILNSIPEKVLKNKDKNGIQQLVDENNENKTYIPPKDEDDPRCKTAERIFRIIDKENKFRLCWDVWAEEWY